MSVSVREQLTRKKPIAKTDPGGHQGGHAGPELGRTIGTFSLMMFGVGATVGTGIFFVLPESVPDAGPAVVVASAMAMRANPESDMAGMRARTVVAMSAVRQRAIGRIARPFYPPPRES